MGWRDYLRWLRLFALVGCSGKDLERKELAGRVFVVVGEWGACVCVGVGGPSFGSGLALGGRAIIKVWYGEAVCKGTSSCMEKKNIET
ncbi:hypothetical protein QBC36DRAFT_334603 [Triangularia setosa]|uniref:Uncharacterized protein n=1 Tax=Triangularia setosa TaxID=2587417 RepID=A0AAN7A5I0_9PEZI|nr:hypothetical protein QBC36DRAFT_334603 [Podospora setosa]